MSTHGPFGPRQDPGNRPARHRINLSVILAALVMLLLALGVIVGVVML